MKKIIKFVILPTFILSMIISVSLGLAWLHSYNKLFPGYKFTRHYKEKMMNSPTLILDRYKRQLGSIGGGEDFHIQAVSSKTVDISTLATILFAKEDRKIKDFDGIQNTGFFGKLEAAMEVISWKGKLRAIKQTFGGNKQGASGLLEQIAGNLYGHQDHNPWFKGVRVLDSLERKIVKTLNAIKIAYLYDSREQIVEDYVNLTYSAGMYHGISAFMRTRFDMDIRDVLVYIDLEKSHLPDSKIDIINMLSYYVGQLTGPANYDPNAARNPIHRFKIEQRAEFKKNLVLSQLLDLGLIHKSLYLEAVDKKLPFKSGDIANVDYDANMDQIKIRAIRQQQSFQGGEIKTTLIKEVQESANYFLQKYRTKLSILAVKKYTPSNVPYLRNQKAKAYQSYRVKVVKRENRLVTIDLGLRHGQRTMKLPKHLSKEALKTFNKGKYISIGIDEFNNENIPIISLIQKDPLIKGAFILKSLTDGRVLAFGGGNYLAAAISPGSAFKPFLVHKSLDFGWSLDDRLDNSCGLKYQLFSGAYYSPKNFDKCDETRKGFQRYPTIKTVIKRSINKPTIYLLSKLTAKLDEDKYRSEIADIFREYDADDFERGDFAYQVKEKEVRIYVIEDNNEKRFIGRISLAGKRDVLIFEKLKKERIVQLNHKNESDLIVKMLGVDYAMFSQWHGFLNDVVEQFEELHSVYEARGEGQETVDSDESREIAELRHFYYDDHGELLYDPHRQDKISFINWETVSSFLSQYKVVDVHLGNFTVTDHVRFKETKEELQRLPDLEFNKRMFIFDPKFQEFLNIEIFKNYLANLQNIDKTLIKGDYSLPLGTHRISLVDLIDMYSQILSEPKTESDRKNNQSIFIYNSAASGLNNIFEDESRQFVLNQELEVFQALHSARNDTGGTSSHLKTPAIIAGKTGTDPKYKTYVAVLNINGHPYLAAAYFGVDHNKHQSLVRGWTGGWTAAMFIDDVVKEITNNYLSYFPKENEPTIEFDPDFEYDNSPEIEIDDDKPVMDDIPQVFDQTDDFTPQENNVSIEEKTGPKETSEVLEFSDDSENEDESEGEIELPDFETEEVEQILDEDSQLTTE